MKIQEIKNLLKEELYNILESEGIEELRPAQEKAIRAGLLNGKNLLICTPTASGKTLIAEIAMVNTILSNGGKAVYISPLKALANEKYNDFRRKYSNLMRIALSIGDFDSADAYLMDYDLIIITSEKLDSLIRHNAPWIPMIRVVIIDEVHLLNDFERGPTLEILITLLKQVLKKVQIIALSATIGNPKVLAEWLNADLIIDDWRPVKLKKGVLHNWEIKFFE
ncbi:MAG: DEAD/DEAH box helicase [Candidatus Woesearchaeota archaeon]